MIYKIFCKYCGEEMEINLINPPLIDEIFFHSSCYYEEWKVEYFHNLPNPSSCVGKRIEVLKSSGTPLYPSFLTKDTKYEYKESGYYYSDGNKWIINYPLPPKI